MNDSNKKLQLIIEFSDRAGDKPDTVDLKQIDKIAAVKYSLPCINSYVIEINEMDYTKLKDIKCIKSFYHNTHITAQMNNVRKIVKANEAQSKGFSGRGVTVAVLDTGVAPIDDFILPSNRIIAFKDFINNRTQPYDDNGHGTHVTGITAGNGRLSGGKYAGIAPQCNIAAVKILNNEGRGELADALAGIQWIIDNKDKYNIKIANLSIGTDVSPANDPLVNAAEAAWDSGITITIAAGNNGPSARTITSPGISRKVITVGASDDNAAVSIWGSSMINFSGRGPTKECVIKPDILAPGTEIVSCLTPTPYDDKSSSEKQVNGRYLKLSGTSMSAPIVSGAAALLLEKQPELCPDDIKFMLKKCCTDLHLPRNQQGWGLLNIEKLISEEVYHVR